MGETSKGFSFDPLALHLEGDVWHQVHIPELPRSQAQYGSEISAFGASAPDDAWAAGTGFGSNTTVGFVMHWDGSTWKRSAIFRGQSGDMISIHGIATSSGRVVWVAGSQSANSVFIANRTKTGWTGALPVDRHLGDALYGIVARPRWAVAVGYRLGANRLTPLHFMWNGKTWRRTFAP
jgi:hypothetical protein